ncbi:MAG: tRNA preQ1(34) S-adenosylmethionine ribosyltransferase-isomerase QueA [Zetaproteobacteria bacterium]|nr:MAG: tRNA preQ1(34) S-adenosylmethionine ribosyltransferase-isomerase QueA [Zetaproteobacteria bacterium]
MTARVADYDFPVPPELIAAEPPERRDGGRLLQLTEEGQRDRMIADLPELVIPGDLWVVNDTRVIPARLFARKPGGGRVELLLIERLEGGCWRAWLRANRPPRPGMVLSLGDDRAVRLLERDGREWLLALEGDEQALLARYGHMPLPPYIGRPDLPADSERYQTIFARHPGAVAAPTAGLHLTEALMARMEAAGATFAAVTLHVGPGTFQPVTCDRLDEHRMHEERYRIGAEAAEQINRAVAEGRRIVCVGTTALRTLETAWHDGAVRAGAGRTRLFIHPGYRWRVVDALLTNFHLPRSTLLMLVCAMAGHGRIRAAYRHAVASGYRFYSYGDAMFIDRRRLGG